MLPAIRCRGVLVGLGGDLHAAAGPVDCWEPIEPVEVDKSVANLTQVHDERRHVAKLRVPLANWEPEEELPVDPEDVPALGEQLGDPGAGAEEQLLRLVRAYVCHDSDSGWGHR